MNDTVLAAILEAERKRQEEELSLIASENYASAQVLRISGSILTNKYAEGYPGKRYYAGCSLVDQAEQLAQERCKQLFNAQHANVQPHAGSQANLAAYFALLQPGDTILGMNLTHGGHLTHGHGVNFSGKLYNCVQYGVDKETEELNYETIAQLAQLHKPKLIIAGASAYSRIIHFDKFTTIAADCGAYLLADIAHIAGLVATQLHPSPVEHADIVTSTTHKTLRGPRGAIIMSKTEHGQAIDRAIIPGTQGGPFMHVIAAKAAAFHEALQPEFKLYQMQVLLNAQTMAKTLKQLGYRIVSGGTDNHLFIVDLRAHNITGRAAEAALEQAGILVSRSGIPFDTQKPWITSGIRIGTPAITTRGLKEKQAEQLAHLIHEVIINYEKESVIKSIKEQIAQLAKSYPMDPDFV